MMEQSAVDQLIATTRRQAAAIAVLSDEVQEVTRQRDEARDHLSALRTLLAVIHRFVILPLPVKAGWQAYYTQGMKRLEQLRWATNELQGANTTMHDAERWAALFETLLYSGPGYEPEPGALPKPKPAERPAELVAESAGDES